VKFEPVPRRQRALAILGGDLTPLHEPQIELDTLVLPDGRKLALRTRGLPGGDITVRMGGDRAKKGLAGKAIESTRAQIEARKRAVISAVKRPESWSAWKPLNAELLSPLDFGTASLAPKEMEKVGAQPAADSVIEARLLTGAKFRRSAEGHAH
jgi:hypothetical protein